MIGFKNTLKTRLNGAGTHPPQKYIPVSMVPSAKDDM
jgi:hypothetical protein